MPDMTQWSSDGVEEKNWPGKIAGRKSDVGEGVAFDLQLADFVKGIRGEEEPRSTAETGLAALIVCEAVKKALETGTAVELEPKIPRTEMWWLIYF
ncbi:hypothetical protein GE09DRAFT_1222212 [Coniochaeta sp. 2T2.1]|nr:hypothetical protein GE09DRAFT_1222212 [Coniochaeta sp. 2T2.1]